MGYYTELEWRDNLEAKILTETESAVQFVNCLSEGFLTQNVCFKTFQKEPNKPTNILDLVIIEWKTLNQEKFRVARKMGI